jgi:hypothetical protein
MSDSFNANLSLFNAFLAPSGMFTCNYSFVDLPAQVSPPSTYSPVSKPATNIVFNPYQPAITQEIVDKAPLEQQTLFLEKYERAEKIKLFDRSDFEDYALTLVSDLVPNLVRQNHDVILFPLRGCRQPGIVTKVIAGIPNDRLAVFNYTYATSESQQETIRSQLVEQLKLRVPDREIVSLGIVDTAKGGNGSLHLAEILAELHALHFSGQKWSVQFHLLHEKSRTPDLTAKAYHIPDVGSPSVQFLWPRLYAVESLFVEDWDDGIGLSTFKDGKVFELKLAASPGRVILRDDQGVSLVESPDLSKIVTGLMVQAVNDLMLDDPDVKYVRDVLENDAGSNNNTNEVR